MRAVYFGTEPPFYLIWQLLEPTKSMSIRTSRPGGRGVGVGGLAYETDRDARRLT